MRVIIPAAGQGNRLRPHTADRPKCLLPVGGIPIIERLLGQLATLGADEVVCVTGHAAGRLTGHVRALRNRPPVRFVPNPDYARSDNIVSLMLTRRWWHDGIVIVDSDVLISTEALERLMASPHDVMAVDVTRPIAAIDMAVELRDGHVWHLDKNLPPSRVCGEFFGVSRWSPEGARRLGEVAARMIADGVRDTWYPYAIRELAKQSPIEPLYVRGEDWCEIDSAQDLAAADARCPAATGWAAYPRR
jgi:choline kinase